MKKLLVALFGLFAFVSAALAQPAGQLPAGGVWGNATASKTTAQATTAFATFNQIVGCTTQGNIIVRGAANWGCTTTGTGVIGWLGTPSSANLRAAITDETGTGVAVFNDTPTLLTPLLTSPTMTGAILGAPASGTLTNTTGFPSANLSGAVPLTLGGTSQTSALTSRGSSGLNIDQAGSTGDANGTILATDRSYYHTALSAARTDTLPAANAVNAGQMLRIMDPRGVVTGSNTVTVQRAGADTVNGGTSFLALQAANSVAECISDGTSRWNCAQLGVTGGASVTSITPGGGLVSAIATGCTQTAITTSGTLSAAECLNAQTGTSYAILDTDRAKLITASNASAQAYTIAQAGAASAFQSGWYVDIYNKSTAAAAVVTVTPTTSTINGASSLKIGAGQGVRIVSDGTNYQIVGLIGNRQYTLQRFLAGTSGTYTTPAGVRAIKITMIGGGAGSYGGGNSPGTPTVGNPTCWNTSGAACTTPVYQAGGGGLPASNANGGTGGTVSGTGTCDWSVDGSDGTSVFSGTNAPPGAASSLGAVARGGFSGTQAGQNGKANSGGSGGAGYNGGGGQTGSVGGAGATCVVIINGPAATYTYAVAATAAGGTAGTSGGAGGNGAGGQIIVEEY